MGMFDTVLVPCPKCGSKNEFQTKAGECTLALYDLDEAPNVLRADLVGESQSCKKCGHLISISDVSPKFSFGNKLV